MATSNFYNKNANSIFAVEIEDEWDYDDIKSNLKSIFENSKYSFLVLDESEKNYNRSYPGFAIGSLYTHVEVHGIEATINIIPIIRSGYYSGINLDWELEIETDYDMLNSVDDLTESMSIFNKSNKKYFDLFVSKCKSTKEEMIEYVEKIYSEYSIPLGVTAIFSNGETIYHKI